MTRKTPFRCRGASPPIFCRDRTPEFVGCKKDAPNGANWLQKLNFCSIFEWAQPPLTALSPQVPFFSENSRGAKIIGGGWVGGWVGVGGWGQHSLTLLQGAIINDSLDPFRRKVFSWIYQFCQICSGGTKGTKGPFAPPVGLEALPLRLPPSQKKKMAKNQPYFGKCLYPPLPKAFCPLDAPQKFLFRHCKYVWRFAISSWHDNISRI